MALNTFNEGYAVYGNTECDRCSSTHAPRFHLRETREARFIMMRIVNELMFTDRSKTKSWKDQTADPPSKTNINSLAESLARREGHNVSSANKKAAKAILQNARNIGEQKSALRSMRYGLVTKDEQQIWEFIYSNCFNGNEPTVDEIKRNLPGIRGRNVERIVTNMQSRGLIFDINAGFSSDAEAEQRYSMATPGLYPGPVTMPDPQQTKGGLLPCMLGVLITQARTYIAASGPNLSRLKSIGADKLVKGEAKICNKHRVQGSYTNVHGRTLSRSEYEGSRRGNTPGDCAAPRLIEQAIADGVRWDPSWAMSEVWYDPKQESGDSYVHGLSAKSCTTCAKLVPLLLCDAVEMTDFGS